MHEQSGSIADATAPGESRRSNSENGVMFQRLAVPHPRPDPPSLRNRPALETDNVAISLSPLVGEGRRGGASVNPLPTPSPTPTPTLTLPHQGGGNCRSAPSRKRDDLSRGRELSTRPLSEAGRLRRIVIAAALPVLLLLSAPVVLNQNSIASEMLAAEGCACWGGSLGAGC